MQKVDLARCQGILVSPGLPRRTAERKKRTAAMNLSAVISEKASLASSGTFLVYRLTSSGNLFASNFLAGAIRPPTPRSIVGLNSTQTDHHISHLPVWTEPTLFYVRKEQGAP
jgi:hypothetical protein